MKESLEIVVEELRRLKAEGVTRVHVSDASMTALRQQVARKRKDAGATAPASSSGSAASAAPERRNRADILMNDQGKLPDLKVSTEVAVTAVSTPKGTILPPPPKVQLPDGDKKVRWDALRDLVLGCPTCNKQVKPGCQVVFGIGSLDADIFFVGEAPGAEEEIAGEPFVGKAGDMLTRMIQAMGLQRSDVYIGNIMNWRPDMPTPTGNRPPTQEEMEFCLPYLLAQLEIVQPKVIVALGNTAVSGLFGPDAKRKMRDLRGQWSEFRGTPTMITYHPSYIIRNGSNQVKRTVWEDMLQVMERVGLSISDKQRAYFLPKG
jgi:uracil-DNA glycosylase